MFWRLSERPGLAHEGCDAAADGEIDSLNEGGLDCGVEALGSEELIESVARPVWSKKSIRKSFDDQTSRFPLPE